MGKCYLACPCGVILLASLLQTGCSRSVAASKEPESARNVELVVYADDFALVHETRDVDLVKGKNRVGIQSVSTQLDQDSVVYSWPDAKNMRVASSTYELGTKDAGRLLQRYLGQPVDLVYRSDTGHEGDRQRGTLEVADPGNIVVRVGDRLVVNPSATIEAPADAGVVTIPQLSADVESPSSQKAKLGVSYLTRGLGWSADYTANLAADADKMSLECWATVTNKTGTVFPDAKLSFVAGSPNRAVSSHGDLKEQDSSGYTILQKSNMAATPASAGVNQDFNAPQRTGELYAYPYKATATIKPDQMNRVRMMGGDAVLVSRDYSIVLPSAEGYAYEPQQNGRISATLALAFRNSRDTGLGLPLPAGVLRVYEPGPSGSVRYIGAAQLSDTPTDAKVSATLTDVFDVYAQCKLSATKRVDKRTVARTFEVAVSNEKATSIELRLVQSFYGKWKVVSETSPSTRLDSNMAQWTVQVPAAGQLKLKYTVNLGY